MWPKRKVGNVIDPNQVEKEIKNEIEKSQPLFQQNKNKEMRYTATIIAGEMMENGVFKFVVFSNKSLGEIGTQFPLD